MGVKKQRGRKWWGGEEQVEVGCSGFSQKKGIDYDETFAPVACLEAIGILLAFFVAKGFKLYQNGCEECHLERVLGGKYPIHVSRGSFASREEKLGDMHLFRGSLHSCIRELFFA
jgi:hypothetical protein